MLDEPRRGHEASSSRLAIGPTSDERDRSVGATPRRGAATRGAERRLGPSGCALVRSRRTRARAAAPGRSQTHTRPTVRPSVRPCVRDAPSDRRPPRSSDRGPGDRGSSARAASGRTGRRASVGGTARGRPAVDVEREYRVPTWRARGAGAGRHVERRVASSSGSERVVAAGPSSPSSLARRGATQADQGDDDQSTHARAGVPGVVVEAAGDGAEAEGELGVVVLEVPALGAGPRLATSSGSSRSTTTRSSSAPRVRMARG